jgi:hypothetical protein
LQPLSDADVLRYTTRLLQSSTARGILGLAFLGPVTSDFLARSMPNESWQSELTWLVEEGLLDSGLTSDLKTRTYALTILGKLALQNCRSGR